jgi:type IV secretion system protein VirB8
MINPNDYITQSRDWFLKQYFTPSVDCIKLMIILIAILTSLNITWSILNMKTKTTIMRLPIYIESQYDTDQFIENLFEPDKTTDEVFAKYMLVRYINLRETYRANLLDEASWESILLNISSMSSNKVFDLFLNGILPSKNPDSPIIKYRYSKSITPVINNIKFTEFSGKKPIAATVAMQSLECSYQYRNCLSRDFNIDIEFEINAYPRFRFKIQNYRISSIINTNSLGSAKPSFSLASSSR